ncbi:hypothetical protein [Paenibacillus thalictri]|uniref:UTRA domain-containing protein n=1 Tax=Paenibacillus thalictri TaxID=2527873 RepID=A0A4Q9DNW1_9BACL|nr:hypothetical protein [Paenibacillus thalictri]TBL75742.1 hypothetical protein EYB31_22415 [Paenibacillus thalictri]
MDNFDAPIKTHDRYITTIELQEKYSARRTTMEMLIEIGRIPTIKDYIDLFREKLGAETEIKDIFSQNNTNYYMMEYKILKSSGEDLRGIKVIRTSKDYTYNPITKI